ncbi:MAG: L-threonylcarbamoyladenylate synthase [Fibrobacterota bacterium]|nr:L-threonylcarbamoyladenylate synthase [Fibrobacterota bacterium]
MRLELHPMNPEVRLMKKVLDAFAAGDVVVYPTDSGYSMGCDALSKKGVHKLYHLKRDMKKYLMALMVRDFGALSEFAKVETSSFRYMKSLVPGPYTFVLPATVRSRKILDVNRPEVGVRMPNSPFTNTLFQLSPEAVILTTAARIREEDNFIDPAEIEENFGHMVDLIVDLGPLPVTPTTVISLVGDSPEIIREGLGPIPGMGTRTVTPGPQFRSPGR